jgi:hypothetical protein
MNRSSVFTAAISIFLLQSTALSQSQDLWGFVSRINRIFQDLLYYPRVAAMDQLLEAAWP